jgi:hypothetical protein
MYVHYSTLCVHILLFIYTVVNTDELQKELRESFNRVESIIVKLIDQQKRMQLEQKGIENSFKTLVEVIAALSGNGLKDKFMRMQERNENRKY